MAVDGVRDFFESSSVKVPEMLAPLPRSVPTVECERSFNAMDDVTSDIRSSRGVKRIIALMFAKRLGP